MLLAPYLLLHRADAVVDDTADVVYTLGSLLSEQKRGSKSNQTAACLTPRYCEIGLLAAAYTEQQVLGLFKAISEMNWTTVK